MYVRQRQEIQEVLRRMNHGSHAPPVGQLNASKELATSAV